MSTYLAEFLRLRCASDVLEAVYPIKKPEKEISESMALITAIRGKVLAEPRKWTVVDLCAGNALTGILAAHLLPVAAVVAVDKRQRIREGFGRVRTFRYDVGDIMRNDLWDSFQTPIIVVASHPCKDLAVKIVSECVKRNLPMAILPCCISRRQLPEWTFGIAKEHGRYKAWLACLAQLASGRFKIDRKCLSPCNGLVTRGL